MVLLRYKDDFAKLLEEKAVHFGVKNLKMVSFSAQRGFGFKYTATDVAVSINAMLELSGNCLPEHNFHNALEALRTEQMSSMQSGIELGKKQLRAVLNTINSNIEMGSVINAGPFLYMLLKDGNPEHHMFAHPASVRLLGLFSLCYFITENCTHKNVKYTGIQYFQLILANLKPFSENPEKRQAKRRILNDHTNVVGKIGS